MKKPIDVRIANFFRRCFAYYIRKRVPIIDSDKILEEKWLNNFSDLNHSFEYNLNETLKIILYKDSVLCKAIYESFEEVEITFLKKFLKQGDVFFDIGANIGLFSLYAYSILGNDGYIYSFEPAPITFDRLFKNVKLNSIKNITIENIGLSNKNDILQFNVATNGFDAWNSFAKIQELGKSYSIEVNVKTLDDYIRSNKISKVELIKLDVEGWELNVLKGAKELLSSPNSPVLIVEFTESNAFAAGYYCGELFDYVSAFGYKWYSYSIEDNKLIEQHKKLHYTYENLIAIKDIDVCNSRLLT